MMHEAGDYNAFVEDHLDLVYGYAAARLGRAEADDVVADVFRSARNTFEAGGGEVLSRSWLLTCTRSKILARWRADPDVAEASTLPSAEPEAVIGINWEGDRVLDALDQLPLPQRAVLALRYLEGRPVAEVAHLIDRPHATTQQLLEKARRAFHALTPPPTAPTAVHV